MVLSIGVGAARLWSRDYMVKELVVLELLIKQDLQILALLLVMVE